MVNYANGKIYKIWSPGANLTYYGSTCCTLRDRMYKHRHNAKKDNPRELSYLVLTHEDARIELVQEFPCENKQQLLRKEGEYINNNECVNRITPGRTTAEYYYDTKERFKPQRLQWYQKNKERILARDKIKIECKCGGKYSYSNKSNHEKTELHKKFIETGIREIKHPKHYECPCGAVVTWKGKNRHLATKKHKAYMNN